MKKTIKFFGITFGLTLIITGLIGNTPSSTLQAEHGKTFMQQSDVPSYVLREHGKTFLYVSSLNT
ncbi:MULTISPECIES: hypothetical protein [Bacillus]|uniref:Uncharacterized protein n=1 Tax=Bacillus pseudomycoides TaxID=64104 RepID=A0A1Y3MKA4_9BACI|nr:MULTISPECIES: hypothetical protein [Bacillus cereus group]EOP54195.1 hypothetical protein IIW_01468 [Bacillus cereus VD136]EOP73422.1 hypothetical protein KOW_00832 [Bacillus cereus VDM006]EOQ08354.1 hypothetical protein KOY_02567 [Bacillus cereus VDM021]OOG92897.1 hypothetical protein BTH41_04919 [Bacillus mycoides]MDF2085510.1 hypothetical protein [Bacillus pseudomycoides]